MGLLEARALDPKCRKFRCLFDCTIRRRARASHVIYIESVDFCKHSVGGFMSKKLSALAVTVVALALAACGAGSVGAGNTALMNGPTYWD